MPFTINYFPLSALVAQSCLTLCDPVDCRPLFPSPGDLPNPGIEPRSPALQGDSLPTEPQFTTKNSSVHGISQARILEWFAIFFSKIIFLNRAHFSSANSQKYSRHSHSIRVIITRWTCSLLQHFSVDTDKM